ncbi:preprotein translocase subunit SecF [archaeon BMS3Abin17]|nr:preprotein translocase subunit SecF [archaeon BMS3Abin17]HDZ61510.1 protein translocase subunit SecF [Candidatus Pacearchaeota archaeon]
MAFKNQLTKIGNLYDKHYKKLIIIPTIILFIAIFLIAQQYITTGEFMNKGVSLKGGITITIPSAQGMTAYEFQDYLRSKFPEKDIVVRTLKRYGEEDGLIIDANFEEDEEISGLKTAIETKLEIHETEYNEEIIGSALGDSFFKQTFKALLFAFLFMGVVVFIYFRTKIPSLAVILAAFSDIVSTLAVVNLLGMKISTAGIAAFLMLIGYSVDTDILLSTKVLKSRVGTVPDRIRKAMKTGFMMSITTLGAVAIGLIFAESEVLIQIMTIIFIGLSFDLIYTWLQNAVLLRMYTEKEND